MFPKGKRNRYALWHSSTGRRAWAMGVCNRTTQLWRCHHRNRHHRPPCCCCGLTLYLARSKNCAFEHRESSKKKFFFTKQLWIDQRKSRIIRSRINANGIAFKTQSVDPDHESTRPERGRELWKRAQTWRPRALAPFRCNERPFWGPPKGKVPVAANPTLQMEMGGGNGSRGRG